MNVIILHGTGETPNSFWMPYCKKILSEKDYKVSVPVLPNTNDPKLNKQLEAALKEQYTEDTILIGHSSGCPLILAILEKINVKINKSIMVAGYSTPLKTAPNDTKNLKSGYDWKKVKSACQNFIFINSVNDPWGADDNQGRYLFNNLGGMLITNNEGHMGSDSFKQPYKEFPLLIKLIEL